MAKPSPDFECVEPALGERLHLLESPDLDAELLKDLTAHLGICHACRERQRFGEVVGELMSAGEGHVVPLAPRRRIWLAAGAGLAAALAFLLVLTLAPSSTRIDERLRFRAVDTPSFRILRPLEGEVLHGAGGRLEWTSLEGAFYYKLTVESADGSFRWVGQAQGNAIELPKGSGAKGNYVAAVEVVPANLVPLRESSVSFERDGLARFLGFRLLHPHRAALALAGLALLLGLATIRLR